MFLTGIMPVLYITLPMIAGVLMMIMSIEVDTRWAFITYIATGLLSLFVTFDKEAALLYILLFGHYPIIKKSLDRIKNKFIRLSVKIIIFNTCILSETIITIKLLGSEEFYQQMIKKGAAAIIIYIIIINFICLSYDYCLRGLMHTYINKLKPKLKGNK